MGFYKSASDKCWFLLSLIFGFTALAILLQVTFGMQTVEAAFGERWVSTEIVLAHLPVGMIPGILDTVSLPIQFKPITGFMAFSFLWFASAYQSLRPPLTRMMSRFPMSRDVIALAAFLLCLISGYETIWNFMAFGAMLASMPNAEAFNKVADSITFQYTYYPVNAVFATKMFWLALLMGAYTLFSIRGERR